MALKKQKVPSKQKLETWFKQIHKLKVFVVGDVMLDQYWNGKIDRISPEAPVPVVQILTKESRLGGAANVALNCREMGAEVFLISVCGKDSEGRFLKELCAQHEIGTEYLIQLNRPTTTKTRILAKNQQVLRVDEEVTSDLNTSEQHHFIDTCMRAIQIEAPDVLIFEDYNKGLLDENTIHKIIGHCQTVGVLTAVDPKYKNFFAYSNCNIFKPNLKEVREALNNLVIPEIESLKCTHQQLVKKLEHQITLITLSEKGVFVHDQKDVSAIVPAFPRKIADVSGAGDTVISVMSLFYAVSSDSLFSALVANLAGGLVCEEVGVVPINKKALRKECLEFLSS